MADIHQALADHAAQLKHWTYAGLGFGSASGAWTWMDDNAGAIGAACSIVGVVVGCVFGYLNYRVNKQRKG